MEFKFTNVLAWYTLLSFVTMMLMLKLKLRQKKVNLPPGPLALPFFGNIFALGTLPHQKLYELKFKYGPVIWLRLGFTNTLVIQSAKAAEQLFKNHDVSFSDRKVPDAFSAQNYYKGSLFLCGYGPNWRNLRRLVTLELMTSKKLNASIHVRQKCVDKMIQSIEEDSSFARATGESGEIVLSRYVFVMAFNLICNLIFSRDLVDSHSEDGDEFFDAMSKMMIWSGKQNLSDLFPFLRALDLQGIRKNMERDLGRAMAVVEKFMKEKIEERKSTKDREVKDFLDSVLECQGDKSFKMSTHQMLIIMLEMFFGGTETASTTIEWAMAELLRSPESMKLVKEELRRTVGPKRKVNEDDLNHLPYLQAIVKESMRLHPIAPLLVPRNTLEDTKFMGYVIPKDTKVFVNAWATGRDSDAWDDPLKFKPERFLNCDVDYRGQNFELIPFGAGRRICVGINLAHRVIHLTPASLLHNFDWEMDRNSIAEATEMREQWGFSVRKLIPLKAIPKKIENV